MAAKKRGRPKKTPVVEEPDQPCAACKGSGKKFTARFEDSSVLTTFADCARCEGTGRVKVKVA